MSNKTKINTNVNPNITVVNNAMSAKNATVINPSQNNASTTANQPSLFPEGSQTVVNGSLAGNSSISFGTVLCNEYKVVDKLAFETGEADLYICEKDNKQYIAKVYRRTVSIKKEVSEKLQAINSPYVASIFATGEYNNCAVEIQPYYKNGSLQGRTFSFDELKKTIIPSLIEGLKILHDNDIIHKDLKPANIMITDDMQNVAIIDFGISSVREDGSTVVVTQTGFTPTYSAPETFKNLFLTDSDYYSLGITLFELFTGKLPYGNLSQEEIERYISVQKLPLPKDMPDELKDLIKALTYYDITNRKDKDNPNRRWGYDEVQKWLNGEKQTLPGEGIGNPNIKPFVFVDKEYTDIHELVDALATNWKQGKKSLFRGYLSEYFHIYNDEAYEICANAEQEASQFVGQDDNIFWKTLYALDKKCEKLYWKGYSFNNLVDLGRTLLESLRGNDTTIPKIVSEMLSNNLLTRYFDFMGADGQEQRMSLATCEQMYLDGQADGRQILLTLYILGYMLSGQKLLYVGEESFGTIGELVEHMKKLQEQSFETLRPFCHSLVEQEGVLAPQFEAWLLTLGKKPELDAWKGINVWIDEEDDF